MTKAEFLNTLSNLLETIAPEERANTLEYYSEMILDRMEDGMCEEEAVAALGDIREIADQAGRSDSEPVKALVPSTAALHSVTIEESMGDLQIEGGACDRPYELIYENCREEDYAVSEQNGALVIRRLRQKKSGIHLLKFNAASAQKLILRLGNAIDQLNVRTSSGDTEISALTVNGSLTVSGASGDVEMERLQGACECSFNTASGDIRLEDCSLANVKIAVASGDIALEKVSAGNTEIRATSGDIEIGDSDFAQNASLQTTSGDMDVKSIRVQNFRAKTLSGDVVLSDFDADDLQADAVSGDIRLRGICANRIQLSAASGDLRVQLREAAGGYDFRAHSTIGDVHVPMSRGERAVELTTTSGDIAASVK